jgi:hypothetical protein
MRRKRSPRRRHLKLLRKLAKERELGYCNPCVKMLWPTYKEADKRIEKMKAKSDCLDPDLLHSYRCPHGDGVASWSQLQVPASDFNLRRRNALEGTQLSGT